MVRIITILFFVSISAKAQYSLDTISKMKAWTNTWMEFSTPLYGTTSNGHVYHVAFVNHYNNGNLLSGTNIEIVRMDLTAHTVTSKLINQQSAATALWIYTMDSLGQVYVGFNTGGRRIWKFNFKDSIVVDSLGNGFSDGQSLAYSMSLGTDKHIYFGASSGSVSWCEYNPYNDTLYKHPEPNSNYQYVLSITGDNNYAYLKVGQNPDVRILSVRKSDNQVKELFRVSGTGGASINQRSNNSIDLGISTDTLIACYSLHDGIATLSSCNNNTRSGYYEVNNPNIFPSPITATSYIDEASKQLFYNVNNGTTDSILIQLDYARNAIRRIFSFPHDTNHIYYVGDQYGVYYDYNVSEDTAYALGNTYYNIYSTLPVNDSECYFGNYPSGLLLLWNRNKPWTVGKSNAGISTTSNPKFIGYFRTNTAAGFHHALFLIPDKNNNIISAGDVIRVDNTCSIGVYNPKKDSMYGYDYNKIDRLHAVSIAAWQDKILLSTRGDFGGTPKIYIYKPSINQMVDSINLGYWDYGEIYVSGDKLIGVAGQRIYKYDLHSKRLIESDTYSAITTSHMLSSGDIAIEMSETPAIFWEFKKLPYQYSSLFECNDALYTTSSIHAIRINGIIGDSTYPLNTPFNRYKYLKRKLNI